MRTGNLSASVYQSLPTIDDRLRVSVTQYTRPFVRNSQGDLLIAHKSPQENSDPPKAELNTKLRKLYRLRLNPRLHIE